MLSRLEPREAAGVQEETESDTGNERHDAEDHGRLTGGITLVLGLRGEVNPQNAEDDRATNESDRPEDPRLREVARPVITSESGARIVRTWRLGVRPLRLLISALLGLLIPAWLLVRLLRLLGLLVGLLGLLRCLVGLLRHRCLRLLWLLEAGRASTGEDDSGNARCGQSRASGGVFEFGRRSQSSLDSPLIQSGDIGRSVFLAVGCDYKVLHIPRSLAMGQIIDGISAGADAP